MKQINAAVLLFAGIIFGITFVYSCGGEGIHLLMAQLLMLLLSNQTTFAPFFF